MALITDTVAAIRALIAARAFTAIAVVTLTLGLGLVTTIVSVVNAYVLRSFPYPAAERLYRVDYAAPGQQWPTGMEQLDWSALSDVIELPIAWDLDVFYLLGRDYPESAPGAWVTPAYVDALGIRTTIGRTFAPEDFGSGSASVALISHRLWQTRFGGAADIVGKTFNAYVSDRPEEPETFTIVGVLSPDLWHLNVYTEVLTPLKAPSFPYQVRLHEGIPPGVAVGRIDALIRRGMSTLPPQYEVRLTSLQESYIAQLKPVLWSVVAAAALVLLIAAANVGVLTIVRGRKRQRELAMRVALGASHIRVARLVALEGIAIGAVSTAFGLVVAWGVLPFVAPFIERSLERRVPGGVQALAVDTTVAGVAFLCGVAITVLLAMVPVAMLWRTRHSLAVTSSARGLTDGSHAGRSRALLIAVEVAASLTLLAGAALMAETAVRMLQVDFGIDADNVVTAGLALRQRSFPDALDRARFYERLEAELQGISGSSAVAFGDWWPLQGSRPRRAESDGPASIVATANPFAVSAQYFSALGIRLLDGRVFELQDRFGSEPVAIASTSLASRLWPGKRAVGNRLTVHADGEGPPHTARVVGVVADVRQSHTDADLLDAYLPLAQSAGRFAFVYLRDARTRDWETELRSAIARVNPEVALGTPRQLAAGLEQERARPRFLAYLLTIFALFAAILALVGMHGVIAYAVRQRQREIAVRVAVGANPRDVTTMFVRHGLVVLACGVAAGIAGAVGLGRVLQSQLYGVHPAEPRIFAATVIGFSAFAFAAVLWPAWRAARMDPVQVLKDE